MGVGGWNDMFADIAAGGDVDTPGVIEDGRDGPSCLSISTTTVI